MREDQLEGLQRQRGTKLQIEMQRGTKLQIEIRLNVDET